MMNPGNAYNQRGQMTLLPGSSPGYHKQASPGGQDPYGGWHQPSSEHMYPSPQHTQSFAVDAGRNAFAAMGQQPSFARTGSQAYLAFHQQDTGMGMYAPQQQRLSGATLAHHAAPPPFRNMPPRGGKTQCQEECVEEECVDSEQFGDEQKPPKPDELLCGIVDKRPLLPVALSLSTVCGCICMMVVQVPMLSRLTDISESVVYSATLPLYAITLCALAFSALMEPGQLPKDYTLPAGAALIDGNTENGTDAEDDSPDRPLPKRAHKCWQYKRPVRRYDHYCRWLTNVIGLLNHREFIIMVSGLVGIGCFGIFLDAALLLAMQQKDELIRIDVVFVLLHMAYSCGLTFMAGPILKIHVGLVSRNEVANEWKNEKHTVVKTCKHGENISVSALSDDEFNALFDSFVYDKAKNPFDKGCAKNCWTFWCTPRWKAGQLGDF